MWKKYVFKMANEWLRRSRETGWADRLASSDENRYEYLLAYLAVLGLTEEQYHEMNWLPNFIFIAGLAVNQGMTFWQAEIFYFDHLVSEPEPQPLPATIQFRRMTFGEERDIFRLIQAGAALADQR